MKLIRRCATVAAATVLFGSGAVAIGEAAAGAAVTLHATPATFASVLATANGDNNGDTVVMSAGFYSGGIVISGRLTLRGAGPTQTTIAGGGPVVLVEVSNPGVPVTITNLTIAGGFASGDFTAGGVENDDAALTLSQVAVTANAVNGGTSLSEDAGGIINAAAMTITNSTVTANTASDSFVCVGGIANGGILTVSSSTVARNSCSGSHIVGIGGIASDGGPGPISSALARPQAARGPFARGLASNPKANPTIEVATTIVGTTIANNTALPDTGGLPDLGAGGVLNLSTMKVTGGAVTGNRAGANFGVCGGGVCNAGLVQIVSTSITSNSATSAPVGPGPEGFAFGGGLYNDGGVSLAGVHLTNNQALGNGFGGGLFNDCFGFATLTSGGVIGNTASSDGGGVGFVQPVTLNGTPVIHNLPDNIVDFGIDGCTPISSFFHGPPSPPASSRAY